MKERSKSYQRMDPKSILEHEPVLRGEVLAFLEVKKGGLYIDATVGGGGHTLAILERGGKVLGIDWDRESLERLKLKVKSEKSKVDENLLLVHGNFKDVAEIARENGFYPARGVLFDLGLSSMQLAPYQYGTGLEASGRGFSFLRDELLDMRMDPDVQGVTAADLLNGLREDQLYELFSQTTQKNVARAVARVVARARRVRRIERTSELVNLVKEVLPAGRQVYRGRRKIPARIAYLPAVATALQVGAKAFRARHPATTIFLALRMAVNSELENLKEGLKGAHEVLGKEGRLVVISFHSGEDRIVKEFLRQQAGLGELTILTKKPIKPSPREVAANPRARSAKLRAAERN